MVTYDEQSTYSDSKIDADVSYIDEDTDAGKELSMKIIHLPRETTRSNQS